MHLHSLPPLSRLANGVLNEFVCDFELMPLASRNQFAMLFLYIKTKVNRIHSFCKTHRVLPPIGSQRSLLPLPIEPQMPIHREAPRSSVSTANREG